MVTQSSIMWIGITGIMYTFTDGNSKISFNCRRFNCQSRGVEVLALEESHLMEDGTSDDDYTPKELVVVVNH